MSRYPIWMILFVFASCDCGGSDKGTDSIPATRQTTGATAAGTPSGTPTGSQADEDGDGFSEDEGDCDDSDPSSYPGAPEIPWDEIDQDCDGSDHHPVGGIDLFHVAACVLKEPSGEIVCWGDDSDGIVSAAPPGTFDAVTLAADHACGLAADTPTCWGRDNWGQATPPPAASWASLSAGNDFNCGVLVDDTLQCFGNDENGKSTPPGGTYALAAAGVRHACAIDAATEAVTCWGNDQDGNISGVPGGAFTTLRLSGASTCGIRADNSIECWGDAVEQPPVGAFTALSLGQHGASCGVDDAGQLQCWSSDSAGSWLADPPPAGTYTAVECGFVNCCAIREADSEVECWGLADYGLLDVP